MDMDIDIDIDCVEHLELPEIEPSQDEEIDIISDQVELKPILDTPNDTSEPNFLDPVPNKIYLRGLENLTTDDIYTYVATYFNFHKPSHIEWIDDLSANLVFPSKDIALEALKSLSANESFDLTNTPVLQTIKAKPFPQYREASLEVRLAVAGDKKQVGARERSRFYLLNPEYDPAFGGKRINSKVTKNYRHKNEGGHRIQKNEGREPHRRDRKTDLDSRLHERAKFPNLNQARATRRGHRREIILISEARDKDLRHEYSKTGKELFPDHEDSNRGRLRDRSISPVQDDKDMRKGTSQMFNSAARSLAKTSNHFSKASGNNNSKELFPASQSKQRLGILDEMDHSIDLFSKSSVVAPPKGSEYHQKKSRQGFSFNKPKSKADNSKEINIRGLAKDLPLTTKGFSIRGASTCIVAKELFPSSNSTNDRKELFDRKTDGVSRQKKVVKDLFS